ncbi:hypothetical protein ACS0TY_013933 [Phlomoides rotata]
MFAPNDPPQDDPKDDNELIVIVDSTNDDLPIFQHEVMQPLPPLDQVDLNLPITPDSLVAEIMVISSDEGSDDFQGYFNSDVELDWSDDENHIPVVMVEETISEIVNPELPNNAERNQFPPRISYRSHPQALSQ